MQEIPEIIDGIRVRRRPDGSFFVPNAPKSTQQYLDKNYIRLRGYDRWYPKPEYHNTFFKYLPLIQGKGVYVVGKGPSLDRLEQRHLPNDWVILGCNEAALILKSRGFKQTIIGVQVDTQLGPILESLEHKLIARSPGQKYKDCTIFHHEELGLRAGDLTANCAVRIAQLLGATEIVMVCFDAAVTGDVRYAKCVGYEHTKGGEPERFLAHRQRIEEVLGTTKATWFIPSLRVEAVDDKPLPLFDNHTTHHVHVTSELPIHSPDIQAKP